MLKLCNKLYNFTGLKYSASVYNRQNFRAKIWQAMFNALGKVREKYV